MRLAIRSIILCLLLTVPASCAAPPETVARPTVQVLRISYPPSLSPLIGQFRECAGDFPGTAIFFEELPEANLNTRNHDIIIWAGDPPDPELLAFQLRQEYIQVVVHPDNPVKGLTDSEIRSLLTGNFLSWSEAGEDLGQVSVWVYPPGDEIQQSFTGAFMQGADYSPFARVAPNPSAMIEAVSADPGAIGLLPTFWDGRSLNAIAIDKPVSLPILALTFQEPEGAARELLACVQAAENKGSKPGSNEP